ncbi:armadillo-type protein [Mycena leptocephala]|nr:armadillo-type protein [Mycena leptocephala]
MLTRCAASPFPRPLPCHRVVAVKPALSIKSADQQASIFLHQKLKVSGPEERARIVNAICARGGEMMHRNWAVQRWFEAATGSEEHRKIVACAHSGRSVDHATNCCGYYVLQNALDCEEDEVCLLIVSELLRDYPATTLVNKHASHVWHQGQQVPQQQVRNLSSIFLILTLTRLVFLQHAFENLEESAKDGIVDELLGQVGTVFGEVAKSPPTRWEKHRQMALEYLLPGLLEFATNKQDSQNALTTLKEGRKEMIDRRAAHVRAGEGARPAMIVDLALSLTGSQLIVSVLLTADKNQRAALYDCIRGHIVTLRGCKTGSKVIWLFDRMRAWY